MGATWFENDFIGAPAPRLRARSFAVKLTAYLVLPCSAASIYVAGIMTKAVSLTSVGIALLVASWVLASIVSSATVPPLRSNRHSNQNALAGNRFDPRYDTIFKDVISPVKMRDGGVHELKLPFGKMVRVRIPPGSKFGSHAILNGMGLPRPDGTRGALWLKLAIHPDAKNFGAQAADGMSAEA